MTSGGESDSQYPRPEEASVIDVLGTRARLRKLLAPIQRHTFVPSLCLVILFTGFVLASPLFAPSSSIVVGARSMDHDAGYAFTAPLPFSSFFPFEVESDGFGSNASTVRLFENKAPLGPGHSPHASIRTEGKGKYSHWQGALWFSASDNSDPRSNGRAYKAIARAQLSAGFIGVVILLDLIFVCLYYGRLVVAVQAHGRLCGGALVLIAIGTTALLAAGAFGTVNLNIAGPANAELVIDTIRHALLGCLLTLVQWAGGAGIALVVFREFRAAPGRIALLGFPFSLVLLALLVLISLVFPFGAIVAPAVLGACLWPLAYWRPPPNDLVRAGKAIAAILALAVTFGCWLGLLAHGATETLPGRPSGDVVFYASSIFALQLPHFPIWYLGNEGDQALPFNMLFPAIGTALLPYVHIDPFLFILAAGGSAYVLSLGIALYAYLSKPETRSVDTFSLMLVGLAVLVAGRYPYWTVESIPIVFTLPLTIAVWCLVRESAEPSAAIYNFGVAVVGSLLSKVTGAATLAPLALTPLAGSIQKLPKAARVVGGAVIAIAALCGLAFVIKLGPLMIEEGTVGPESYTNWQLGFAYDLPFILRDVGTLVLVVLAYRLSRWPIATSLALGLVLALVFSFFLRINFACAAIVIGLLFTEKDDKRTSDKVIAVAAFGLCLPAMLMTDFGGAPAGLFWLLCIGGTAWVVLSNAAPRTGEAPGASWLSPRISLRFAAMASIAVVLCLVGVVRGRVVLNPGDRRAYLQISPDARDIWIAVRAQTPRDALIFTDQTGPEPGLLTGWNTFVLSGERQVYVAGWYQSPSLRISPARRAERLALNADVLAGRLVPTELKYSRFYGAYFSVVRRDRQMPPAWKKMYANSSYALYEYEAPQ
jgi:hypothetical protein